MNAKTNAQGKDRKNAFTYTVGNYMVERDGSITTEDEAGMKNLAAALREQGFGIEMPEPAEEPKVEETETPVEEETTTDSWTLTMPREDFTETQVDNLEKLIASKAGLIKKALDCEDPIVILTEDRVVFPWFKRMLGSGESMAVMHFITALCRMAKNAKRITAKEKEVPNEKYAFRCFLLRLGYIGAEYKEIRKRLLERLEGSSAFRTPEEEKAEVAEQEA